MAFYPWAHALAGRMTLTGEWLGSMTTPTGTMHLVWIKIDHPFTICYDCPTIEGKAATCHASEAIHSYDVWGRAVSWNGDRFYLKTAETETSSVHLLYLEGKWSGDRLDLTTTLVAPGTPTTTLWERNGDGQETTTVVGGHPDTRAPIIFSLRRGTHADFARRCAVNGP